MGRYIVACVFSLGYILSASLGIEGQAISESSFASQFVFGVPDVVLSDNPHVMMSTASPDPINTTITIHGTYFEVNSTLVRGSYVDITLPNSVYLRGTGVADKTVVVRANGKVSVHVMANEGWSGDGFFVLPTHQLGTNYYVLSYPQHKGSSFICVSALSKTTTVDIATTSGQTHNIVLQQYQTYRLSKKSDLTGSRVTSDYPVTVVAGTYCTFIGGNKCDALVGLMPPVGMWGTRVTISPFTGKSNGYKYRVLGTSVTTAATISNVGTETLIEGQWYEGDVSDDTIVTIEAEYPLLVMQYIKSDAFGDPSMILAPSTNMYTSGCVTFPVFDVTVAPYSYYIHVIIHCGEVNRLKYDDSIMTNWTIVTSPDGEMCSVHGDVTAGAVHTVSHEDGHVTFTVAVYGFLGYLVSSYPASYAYPADIGVSACIHDSVVTTPRLEMITTTRTPSTADLSTTQPPIKQLSTATLLATTSTPDLEVATTARPPSTADMLAAKLQKLLQQSVTTNQTDSATLAEEADRITGDFAFKLPLGESVKVTIKSLFAEARSFNTSETLVTSFSVPRSPSEDNRAAKASLDISRDALNGSKGVITITLVYIDHDIVESKVSLDVQNSTGQNSNDTTQYVELASGILGYSVYVDNRPISVDPTLTLEYENEVPKRKGVITTGAEAICAFWQTNMSTWSTEGCTRVSQTDEQVKCYCSHTTSYAVLLQVTQHTISEVHSLVLSYLTIIGCVLSIVALALCFGIFMAFRILRTAELYIIHSNFAVALMTAQLTFLIGVDRYSDDTQTLCRIIAMLIHYLYLSVFCWMLVEGINLFLKIVLVFNTETSKIRYYCLLGWGLPAVIVSICAGSAWKQYASDKICWIGAGSQLIWGFAGPAAIIILLNILLLGTVGRILYRSIKSISKDGDYDIKAYWATAKGTFILTPLLGITWVFGFLAIGEATLVFQYIFVFFNSLQGVFFFIFFCLLNKEVKVILKRYKEQKTLERTQFSTARSVDVTQPSPAAEVPKGAADGIDASKPSTSTNKVKPQNTAEWNKAEAKAKLSKNDECLMLTDLEQVRSIPKYKGQAQGCSNSLPEPVD